ncbi:MAG: hypothetical protein HRT45_18925 [Bdellovibrionales bacterium]|nr:hypothetical protein [Bdellovibrionales bacterium]
MEHQERIKELPELDEKAIDYNLILTPTERLQQHQASFETVLELEKAHKKLYAKPQSTSQNSTPSGH